MKLKQKIGIIGRGFVGSAVEFGFSPNTGCDAEVRVYDKDPSKSLNTLQEVVTHSDIIFLSVPTPSNSDGSMNLDIVDSVLNDINEIYIENEYCPDNVILLRSTVTPGTTRNLQSRYPNLRLVFNPEFLTERSAKFDFINQSRFILGCGDSDFEKYQTEEVADLFRDRFGDSISIIETISVLYLTFSPIWNTLVLSASLSSNISILLFCFNTISFCSNIISPCFNINSSN